MYIVLFNFLDEVGSFGKILSRNWLVFVTLCPQENSELIYVVVL